MQVPNHLPHLKRFKPSRTHRQTLWDRLSIKGSVVGEVEKGFSLDVINGLQEELNVTQDMLLRLIDVPPRTLARRKKEGALNVSESDRVARIINAMSAAERLFEGNIDQARYWLQQRNRGLGGKSPLSMLTTEAGAREVLDLIGRMEHGVFA